MKNKQISPRVIKKANVAAYEATKKVKLSEIPVVNQTKETSVFEQDIAAKQCERRITKDEVVRHLWGGGDKN